MEVSIYFSVHNTAGHLSMNCSADDAKTLQLAVGSNVSKTVTEVDENGMLLEHTIDMSKVYALVVNKEKVRK